MNIEHVLFSSNTQKILEAYQKLALTHPIAVYENELKNNWMQNLDRVNQTLEYSHIQSDVIACIALW